MPSRVGHESAKFSARTSTFNLLHMCYNCNWTSSKRYSLNQHPGSIYSPFPHAVGILWSRVNNTILIRPQVLVGQDGLWDRWIMLWVMHVIEELWKQDVRPCDDVRVRWMCLNAWFLPIYIYIYILALRATYLRWHVQIDWPTLIHRHSALFWIFMTTILKMHYPYHYSTTWVGSMTVGYVNHIPHSLEQSKNIGSWFIHSRWTWKYGWNLTPNTMCKNHCSSQWYSK
jgi:hypothetical protein